MERLWKDTAAACEKHACFNVLGIANTSTPVEAVEGYDLAGLLFETEAEARKWLLGTS